MKISTKGRYALRVLIDLAENGGEGPVSLSAISVRQGISKKYLEQIIPLLNSAGMLQTNRGARGGYRLSKTPADYTVGEILRVTEGNIAPVSCLEGADNPCERNGACDVLYIWQGLYEVMENYLDRISIQDILDRKRRKRERDDIVLL